MSHCLDRLPDFRRGDTFDIPMTIVNSTTGLPIDISGYVFTTTLKADTADADSAAKWQVTKTATGPDAVLGKITLSVAASITYAIEPGAYVLDVQRTIPGVEPQVRTLLYQAIRCLPDVTRGTPPTP